jgi:hypothetical protein
VKVSIASKLSQPERILQESRLFRYENIFDFVFLQRMFTLSLTATGARGWLILNLELIKAGLLPVNFQG